MRFRFSEEQRDMRDAVRDLLAHSGALEAARERLESNAGFDRLPGFTASVGQSGGLPPRSVVLPGISRLLILRIATVANVVVSMSNFHEALLPPSLSSLQQYAGVGLWLVTICVALGMRPVLDRRMSTDAWAIAIFFGFAITSVLWSDLSISSTMKAAALLVTSTGAVMLATRLDLQDIIFDVNIGLLVLTAASIIVVVLLPDVGVSQEWSHEGNWQGIFVSKQSLGVLGGMAEAFTIPAAHQIGKQVNRYAITQGLDCA